MDKYWVYRPMLDLIGYAEGTDRGDGYNETLGYGIMVDGHVSHGRGTDLDLTRMTIDQVYALQRRMLKDPDNRWNSSAVGRYQIVSKTLNAIRETLDLPGNALFDEDMQDRMACYLLGVRGIDKYLAGRLSENTLINNLAREWASLPTTEGKGHYSGQRAAVPLERVRSVLAEVRRRHLEVTPRKPVVPETVETEVKRRVSLWQWITSVLGSGSAGLAGVLGADWQTIAAIGCLAILMLMVVVMLRGQIVAAVREIREELGR